MKYPLHRHPQGGATAVEFALVFPLLAMLLFGMVEGMRLMVARSLLSYAVEKGARVASLRSTTTVGTVQSAVATAGAYINISSSAVHVQINSSAVDSAAAFTARTSGDNVRVYLSYVWTPIIAFAFSSSGVTLNGSSTADVE
jgi:Flp pilus assembly protein TadG